MKNTINCLRNDRIQMSFLQMVYNCSGALCNISKNHLSFIANENNRIKFIQILAWLNTR